MSLPPPRQRPPGPDRPLTLTEIRGDPLHFLQRMAEQYGEIVQYGTGEWLAVLVNRPEYVQHILQDNFRNYIKAGTPDQRLLKPMLGEGLLTSDGDSWKQQRRMLAPPFRHQSILAFAPLIVAESERMLDAWAARPASDPFLEIGYQMSQLTLHIVARALFTYEVHAQSVPFSEAVEVLNESMGYVNPHDPTVLARFYEALAYLHGIVEQIIQARRTEPGGPPDALALMRHAQDEETGYRLSDEQLRDQTLTLLLAGHETTAKALTWTLYLLARHPDEAARLQAEIDAQLAGRAPTVDDLAGMPTLWAVLQEAMRLFPPIWIISRRALADDTLDGYHIPANALIPISPYLLHHHPAYWREPSRFDPTRFAPDAPPLPPFLYLPFGGGPRHCIGQHFASLELQLVLATILQRFRLTLLPGAVVEAEALVTLRPRHGLWMSLHERA